MSRRRQPQARLSADARKAQIHLALQQAGTATPAEIAKAMGCSDALVLFYAKQMAMVALARRQVQTAMGSRTRTYLELVGGAA